VEGVVGVAEVEDAALWEGGRGGVGWSGRSAGTGNDWWEGRCGGNGFDGGTVGEVIVVDLETLRASQVIGLLQEVDATGVARVALALASGGERL
jgi:hypothetical protein